jgi:hypothetical protein
LNTRERPRVPTKEVAAHGTEIPAGDAHGKPRQSGGPESRLSVAEKERPANLADYRTISDALWSRLTGGKEGTVGRTIGRLAF